MMYNLSHVKEAASQNLFTVVSLFAGGGGSSTGYKLSGGNILAINEFVEEACLTYSSNYPETFIFKEDIKNLTGEEILNKINLKPGELDILDGSPPCSAFSLAGSRESGWNQTKIYSDGKLQENIEDLFLDFVRIASIIKPKVIVAENVKGITLGKAREKLNLFINSFDSIGYITTYSIIDASDFNTPQSRERTIFICIREDIADKIGINELNLSTIFPVAKSKKISIKEAIDNIENDPEEEQMLLDYVQSGYQKKIVEMLPINPNKTLSPSSPEFQSLNPNGSFFGMKRPCPDSPSPTLTANGQSRSGCGVLHYSKQRKLTIKEMKCIMGLPYDYVLTGSFDKKAERIGRMVAPLMMKEISNSIYNNILRKING